MVGGPAVLGNLERPHPEALGELRRRRPARPAWSPATAHGAPARSAPPSGIVCSGWRLNVSAPRSAAAARASRPVAPLVWPTRRKRWDAPATPLAGLGDRAVGNAQQGCARRAATAGASLAAGGRDVQPGRSGRARRCALPTRPRADDRQSGQCGDVGGRAGGFGSIPFQFPHEIPDGFRWSGQLAGAGPAGPRLGGVAATRNCRCHGRRPRGYHRARIAPMPIYEFECEDCGADFDDLVAGRHRARELPAVRLRADGPALLRPGVDVQARQEPRRRPPAGGAQREASRGHEGEFKQRRQAQRDARDGKRGGADG